MTLSEAVAAYEAKFSQVVSCIHGTWSHAPNGARFDKFVPGGRQEKGRLIPKAFATQDEAVAAWLGEASDLQKGKPILYWRVNPHIVSVQGGLTVVSCMAFGKDGDKTEYE